VSTLIEQMNAGRKPRLAELREHLRPLPDRRLESVSRARRVICDST